MPRAALERHPAARCPALRAVEASISRDSATHLNVAFFLEGEIARLRIPPPRAPRLAQDLWQHTCCEVFVAEKGAAAYREFNLSPSGEWAAYAFERYRRGAEVAAPPPRIAVNREEDALELSALIPFEKKGRLDIGLSMVVEDEDGALSYWALRHAPGQPDFHRREAFALELE
jgi:hypothetical protein